MADTWPDADLERQMLADCELVKEFLSGYSAGYVAAHNCSDNVRALLERVRTLEKSEAEYADVLDLVLSLCGPPLIRDKQEWSKVMARANKLLGATDDR